MEKAHKTRRKFSCDECREEFDSAYILERHVGREHKIKVEQVRDLDCPHCPQRFLKQCNLSHHINMTHKTQSEKFSCPSCDLVFNTLELLTVHTQFEQKKIKIPCKSCQEESEVKLKCDEAKALIDSGITINCKKCTDEAKKNPEKSSPEEGGPSLMTKVGKQSNTVSTDTSPLPMLLSETELKKLRTRKAPRVFLKNFKGLRLDTVIRIKDRAPKTGATGGNLLNGANNPPTGENDSVEKQCCCCRQFKGPGDLLDIRKEVFKMKIVKTFFSFWDDKVEIFDEKSVRCEKCPPDKRARLVGGTPDGCRSSYIYHLALRHGGLEEIWKENNLPQLPASFFEPLLEDVRMCRGCLGQKFPYLEKSDVVKDFNKGRRVLAGQQQPPPGRLFNQSQVANQALVARPVAHPLKLHNCDFCSFSVPHFELLVEHNKSTHQGRGHFKCKSCEYTSTWLQDIKSHVNVVHEGIAKNTNKSFPCEECTNRKFESEAELNLHIDQFHSKVYNCDSCEYKTGDLEDIKKHVALSHSDQHDCDLCKFYGPKVDLKKHLRSAHGYLVCFQCDHRTKERDNIIEHLKCLHKTSTAHIAQMYPNIKEKGQKYPCNKCSHKAETKHDLKVHDLDSHRKRKAENDDVEGEISEETKKCPIVSSKHDDLDTDDIRKAVKGDDKDIHEIKKPKTNTDIKHSKTNRTPKESLENLKKAKRSNPESTNRVENVSSEASGSPPAKKRSNLYAALHANLRALKSFK